MRQLPRTAPAWRLLSLLCALAISASALFAETAAETGTRMLDDVKYLASDELRGRGVGTEGLDKAAEFIREEFEKAGLDVTTSDGGAFQTFTMTTGAKLGEHNSLAFVGPDGQRFELKHDDDFVTCSFGGSGEFDAGLVFVGYGIDAPDEDYNDFAGIDLKGKVALIIRRVPQQADPHGAFAGPHGGMSRHAELRTKVSNAYRAGAAAVILVNDPYTSRKTLGELQEQLDKAEARVVEAAEKFDAAIEDDQETFQQARKELAGSIQHLQDVRALLQKPDADPLVRFGYGGTGDADAIPVFHITQAACNRLLTAGMNKTLEQIESEIDENLAPQSAVLEGWQARGVASVRRIEAEVKNVIGVLEGTGPHADETIVIGAHYDHLGLGGPDSGSLAIDPKGEEIKVIHNGADDNASGTASLIELARRLAAQRDRLSRRVVFIAFTAEETGLRGSAHYVREPVFPLESTVAMLNMDMVGRLQDDKLTVFGTGTSSRWKELVDAAGKEHGLEIIHKPEGFGPSDHSSFYAKKIPVLHFFSGTHRDYHRPSDDWDKINAAGMARVTNLIEDVARATIEGPERPDYIEVKQPAMAQRGGNRPYFGSIPDFGTNEPGYALSGVAPGSPADQGGLKGGDRIIEFGGQKIGGLDDFDLALRKFKPGEEVRVTVVRDGKERSLKVTLGKPR